MWIVSSKHKNSLDQYGRDQVLSVSKEYGVVNQIEHLGRSYAGKSLIPYSVLQKGMIVYTKSPLKDAPYGIVKSNQFAEGIVSTLYACYRTKSHTDSIFVEYFFANDLRLNRYFKPIVNIGAKNDMKINNDFALSNQVTFPELDEQQKIAEFLTAVDEKIGKLKRKKELLEAYKKGAMQKLFSQEIRFKDDQGHPYPDWEEKRLGDVVLERNESGMNEKTMLSVTINSGIRRFDELGKKDNSNPDKSKYKKLIAGDIAYNTMRLWQGALGLAGESGFVSPAYTILKGSPSLHMEYFACWMKLPRSIFTFQRNSQGLTSDQWSCKFPVFSKIKTTFPSLPEQQKIAEFLTGIDDKIKAVANQIEKAAEFKKGLLQKMFV